MSCKRRSSVELASKAFEALAVLGGDTLLIVPGQWEASQSYASVWSNALDTARRVAELAERFGVKVGLENVENRFLLSPREWMQFLDEVASPRVRMYFDVGNVLYMRLGHPEQWIRQHGLSGTLTAYPLDIGTFHWAVGAGHFTPKRDDQRSAESVRGTLICE